MLLFKSVAPVVGATFLYLSFVPSHAAAMTVLLVPGLGMEGAIWRDVSERLADKEIESRIVQLPFTSMKDDLDATKRAAQSIAGPHVLVGHSYGGMLVSQVAQGPSTKALVYVAAFQPEAGESLAGLNAKAPPEMSDDPLVISADGYFTLKHDVWMHDVANGTAEEDAAYWARAQAAVNIGIFSETASEAGWKQLPVWSVIATEDRTVSPDLQRWMSERSKAQIVELRGGHLLPLTHAAEIADLIEQAIAAVD